MAEELVTIPKFPVRPPALDYEFLRREGMVHIEDLAHDIWTDYNTHDPGITMLEALCYAITELGYRSGFDIKDLIPAPEIINQALFTTKEILTIHPLTINDFRKLLIDINGVHNAWLYANDFATDANNQKIPVNEIPIYADCAGDKLVTTPTALPLLLSGLYRVLLDLDQDERFGDLNNGEILFGNPASSNFKNGVFLISAELPSWKEADFIFAAKAADQSVNNINTVTVIPGGKQWIVSVTLTDASAVSFDLSIPKMPVAKVTDADITEMINAAQMRKVFDEWLRKIMKARDIVRTAVRSLQAHRNLCEDFLSVTTVEDEEIAFCFDVDVKPGADIEEVEAEIFFLIENYLNPSVDFYSLKELIAKGIPVDEIFLGPVLSHGFIDEQQLEQTNLRSCIHTSDIINLLMDIDGVTAIRNFVMTKYDQDGKIVPGFMGLKWCMDIGAFHKPVLSTERSKVLLFKNQIPFLAHYEEVKDTISLLHAQRSRNKLNGFQQDLPVPVGRKRDTESYWPVQYDLPQTYGVGRYGLPANADTLRIARQRQLKAYLMFYEQLLADFFSQLTNAYKLFSITDIKSTYYARFLDGIKDISPVYKLNGGTPLIKEAITDEDSTKDPQNRWQELYERNSEFEDRRGRFLDHLLARFAESFNDYALLMYRIDYEDRTQEKISFAEITASKQKFLKNYPEISANRGRAYNYFPQKDDFTADTAALWDTSNVSGLEERICFLTGISDYTRRFLYCIKNIDVICEEETVTENGKEILKCFHRFSVTTLGGKKMISGKYEKKTDAEQAVLDAIERGADKTNYTFDTVDSKLKLTGTNNETLLQSDTGTTYPDENSAMLDADLFAAEFSGKCNDPIGLHLLEHILLRPRITSDGIPFDLMEVCLHDCDCPCETDPYSFRVSVVLPCWPGHFDNLSFREYFEMKIREEAPAQVMLKICWLSNDNMRQFELAYKNWIETLATYASETSVVHTAAFRKANNEMLNILKQLHSEYPEASLHDCDESKDGSNVVMLGKTILGTFKNQ